MLWHFSLKKIQKALFPAAPTIYAAAPALPGIPDRPRLDQISGIQRATWSPKEVQSAYVLASEACSIERQNDIEAWRREAPPHLVLRLRPPRPDRLLRLAGFTISGERQSAIGGGGWNARPLKSLDDGEQDRDGIVQVDW